MNPARPKLVRSAGWRRTSPPKAARMSARPTQPLPPATDVARSAVDRFAEQAARTPHALALTTHDERWTYARLDRADVLILDAVVLAGTLARSGDLTAGLRSYEDQRRERTRLMVNASRALSEQEQLEDPRQRHERDEQPRRTTYAAFAEQRRDVRCALRPRRLRHLLARRINSYLMR